MKQLSILIIILFSQFASADGGVCACKPEFDPMKSYCEYNTTEKTCNTWWEECTWIPGTDGTCQPRDPNSSNYCSQLNDRNSCNVNSDCIWN
jgi:hypothetical protein